MANRHETYLKIGAGIVLAIDFGFTKSDDRPLFSGQVWRRLDIEIDYLQCKFFDFSANRPSGQHYS